MDQVFITDLVARGIIGVYDHERLEPQDILINITLYTDLSKAGKSDHIDDTVDYHQMARKVLDFAESAQRHTLEALAADLTEICLATPGVQRVRLRVEKPGVVRFTRSVGVEIDRQRE